MKKILQSKHKIPIAWKHDKIKEDENVKRRKDWNKPADVNHTGSSSIKYLVDGNATLLVSLLVSFSALPPVLVVLAVLLILGGRGVQLVLPALVAVVVVVITFHGCKWRCHSAEKVGHPAERIPDGSSRGWWGGGKLGGRPAECQHSHLVVFASWPHVVPSRSS